MISNLIKKGILGTLLLTNLLAFSADDKIMYYLNGSKIDQYASIFIMDQQHGGFFKPPASLNHWVKESYVTATLRYEESILPLFGVGANQLVNNYTLIVNYDIDLTDANQVVTTKTAQSLTIDYSLDGASYKDIDVLRYKGYMQGDLTITSISFKEGAITRSVTDIPDDVYLELSCEVERYYELQNPSPWTVQHATAVNSKNELGITWDYVLGAESFDVEWVFVDISDEAANLPGNITQSPGVSYDWRDATRVNTTNDFYNISMAYPSGMLIYRVRPVGVDVANQNSDIIIYGDWSDPGTTTNTYTAWNTNGNGFPYHGLEGKRNWTYNVAYAEEGKRKEGISYFDGSARSRQEVTIVNTDSNAIVGETMYDFEGRPAVSFLPTPLASSGIVFYENGTGVPFNGGYSKNDFDQDGHHPNGPDDITNAPSASVANNYYNSPSSSTALFADFIPDAVNYPFSRTTYKRDGTDRIKEQTGVGSKLMHGTSNTTKYFYGSPAAMEIERLFGNEVGPSTFYQKNMVADPNGQVSIQYLDKEGRTIATSLAGTATSPLLDLDYTPTPVTISADLLSNNTYTANSSKSTHVLTLPNGGQVDFKYDLTPKKFAECVTTTDTSDVNYPLLSFQCSYVLNIQIFDENGKDLLSGARLYTGYFDGTPVVTPFTFSHTFPSEPGTYSVVKTLTIDDVKRLDYLEDFQDYILDNLETQTCVPYNPPPLENCDMDCDDFCDEAYRDGYYDEDTETWIYTYFDDYGDVITPNLQDPNDPYFDLIEDCKDLCEEAPELAPDMCAHKLEAMKIQISPGGQYFDNLLTKYLDTSPADGLWDLNSNGEPTPNTNYDIDGWLESTKGVNSTTAPNAIFGYKTLPSTEYTWAEIRSLWDSAPWASSYSGSYATWMDEFVTYHPEYCAYDYNCIHDATEPGVPGNVYFDRSHVLDYEYYMMSGGSDYADKHKTVGITNPTITTADMDFLNPTGIYPNNTTDNGANADNSGYMDAISGSGNVDDPHPTTGNTNFWEDPLFANWFKATPTSWSFYYHIANGSTTATTVSDAKVWIEDRLKNYLPVDGSGPNPSYTNPTKFHSIWYVMADPAGIAACSTATQAGVSQQVFDLYNNLHGNSLVSPKVEGILDNSTTSPDPSKMNRYQFFRGVYKFYRDYILYHLFKEDDDYCDDALYSYWNGDVVKNNPGSTEIDLASYNGVRDQTFGSNQDWFQLVWPRNLVFDLYDNDNTMSQIPTIMTTVNAEAKTNCETDCDNNAQAWLNAYDDCIQAWVSSGSLNSSQEATLLTEIKGDLLEICKLECNATLPNSTGRVGSSSGDGTTLLSALNSGSGPRLTDYLSTGFPSSSAVATFASLITYYDAYFSTTCTKTVIYPDPMIAPSLSVKDCNCKNLVDFAYALTPSLTRPFSQANYSTIATAVNNLASVPAGTYAAADIERWDDYCQGNYGDIIDFAPELECVDCKCDNLAFFINTRFDDPNANPPVDYDPYNLSTGVGGEADDVAGLLNSEFGTSFTHTEITTMMDSCDGLFTSAGRDTNVTKNPDFVDLPNFFRCNEDQKLVDPAVECASELNRDNLLNYLNLWDQQFANAANDFYNNYTTKCMEGMNGVGENTREEFTAEYDLNEFMYTLYYYDQAGNLIKTVSPEGLKPKTTGTGSPLVPDQFFTDVDDHRSDPYDATSNPSGTKHQNVNHTLVTQYKYDSYNNLIEQSTPDGGTTKFWYDKLGRLVLSQNAKQATVTPNNAYSYTLYDKLGRIYEVGEVESATAIDATISGIDAILDHYEDEFIPWVTGGTGVISTNNYPTTTRTDVTSTYYDETLNATVNGHFIGYGGQKELRTRVSSITREKTFDGSDATYDYGTHFSYDIHGNVEVVIQENNETNTTALNQRIKHITYEYDLISGNVNKVNYQKGRIDQYFHRYCYDADNRITKVETSTDDYIWDTDAKYFYYEHGPLARAEIGEKQVAGSDYAYTLQGWLKGVNSNTLTASLDIGADADLTTTDLNKHFATDAYGFSLGYFEDDYDANTTDFLADVPAASGFNTAAPSMYNGNIRHMVTNLLNNTGSGPTIETQGVAYRYDQANRIRKSNAYTGVTSNSFNAATDNGKYETEYHYDLNGNITELKRNNQTGSGTGTFNMDDVDYQYENDANAYVEAGSTGYNYSNGAGLGNTNQLTKITDAKGVVNTTDIGVTQSANNYVYDEIGQLTKDISEHIGDGSTDGITWDVYNKITEIKLNDPSNLQREDILFKYDASGNRIAKILKSKDVSGNIETADKWTYYYYDRDASGNIIAVYKETITHVSGNAYTSEMELIETDIYGSSRLGINKRAGISTTTYFNATFTTSGGTIAAGNSSATSNQWVEVNSDGEITISDDSPANLDITMRANNADVILGIDSPYTVVSGSLSTNGSGELYLPAGTTVNLQVNDNSITADPANHGYYILPNNGNTLTYTSSGPLSTSTPQFPGIDRYARNIGDKVYEKTNHLGNVLVTMSDRKLPIQSTPGAGNTYDYYEPDVQSFSDYYPFGQLLTGRSQSAETYRFGFIGQENDNEENSITGADQYHKFRSYDNRLGRYKSLDPLAKSYPWNSPYAYAENRVIDGIDLEGLEYSRTADGKLHSGPVDIKPLNAKIVAEKGVTLSSTDAAAAAVFNTFQSGKYTGQSANMTTQPDFKSSSKFLSPDYISSLKDGLDLGLGAAEMTLNQMDKANIKYGNLNSGKGGNFYKNFHGSQHVTMSGNIKGGAKFLGKLGNLATVGELVYGGIMIGLAETPEESKQAKQDVAISGGVAGLSLLNPLAGFTVGFGLVVNETEEVDKLKRQDKKAKMKAKYPVASAFEKAETIGPGK